MIMRDEGEAKQGLRRRSMEYCRSHDDKQYIRPLYFGEEKNLKNEQSTISDDELI